MVRKMLKSSKEIYVQSICHDQPFPGKKIVRKLTLSGPLAVKKVVFLGHRASPESAG